MAEFRQCPVKGHSDGGIGLVDNVRNFLRRHIGVVPHENHFLFIIRQVLEQLLYFLGGNSSHEHGLRIPLADQNIFHFLEINRGLTLTKVVDKVIVCDGVDPALKATVDSIAMKFFESLEENLRHQILSQLPIPPGAVIQVGIDLVFEQVVIAGEAGIHSIFWLPKAYHGVTEIQRARMHSLLRENS